MRDDQARIAQVAGAFGVAGVLVFDHLANRAIGTGDDPAISERIGRAETKHRDLRPAFQRAEQAADGVGAHHRAIAKTHQDQPAEIGQRRFGLQGGVGGSQLRLLQCDCDITAHQRGAQLFVPIPRHHHRAGQRSLSQTVEQVEQHRLARNRVQHLVQVALHAGALARGKNYGGKRLCQRFVSRGHESPCKLSRACQQILAV